MEILQTERLLLRTWDEGDFDEAWALWGDPKVIEFIDARSPLNEEQVKERLQHEIFSQKEHGIQYWKVCLKPVGEMVGACGLRPYAGKKDMLEIGFQIGSAHWGKGYATEAALGVIERARGLGVKTLFAGHSPKNEPSRRMMEKLGFNHVGEEFYEPTGQEHRSYELRAC